MPTDQLIDGEALPLGKDPEAPQITATDEQIVTRYSQGEIRIVTEQARTQLAELPLVLKSGRYKKQPDYQRRHRWDVVKQSRLIESFIMNVPVPPIFLYEYEYSKYEVMDGLQRLTALGDFYEGKYNLTGLEHWPELEGRAYDDLPLQLRQAIDRRHLSSIVLLYETAEDPQRAQRLKELVFERINSGGVKLSDQESRNALSTGPLNVHLPRLARNRSFCRLWDIAEPPVGVADDTHSPSDEVLADVRFRSMEDVEMVLRFFAHRQRGLDGAPRRLKAFLDDYWTKANASFDDALVRRIGRIFTDTIELVEVVLGPKAFYLRRDRQGERIWVPRPTLLAYDTLMAVFSQRLDVSAELQKNSREILLALETVYDEHAMHFDGRKTDPKDFSARESLVSDAIDSALAR